MHRYLDNMKNMYMYIQYIHIHSIYYSKKKSTDAARDLSGLWICSWRGSIHISEFSFRV